MIYLIILNVVIISFGMYFKKQNDEYERKNGKSKTKCYEYMRLRFEHPHIYNLLIDHYARRLLRGKKIEQYQKDVLIDFIIFTDDNKKDDDIHFTRYDLQDEELLKMQFNQEYFMPLSQKIKRKLFKRKNKNKKEKNDMFEDNNDFILGNNMYNNHMSNFDDYDYDSYNKHNNRKRGVNSRSYKNIM